MPSALVIDDSPVARKAAGELLSSSCGLEVYYAASGEEGLVVVEERIPDIVVTDLELPGMDGIELIARLRKRAPLVPVVLMTGVGNEDVARRALEAGAASYVPKKVMGDELVETVDNVLAMAAERHTDRELEQHIRELNVHYDLPNEGRLFASVIKAVRRAMVATGLPDGPEITRVGVALEEALTNAMHHGNLEVSSRMREEDFAAYFRTIEERSHTAPWKDRPLRFEAEFHRGVATFVVEDGGPGFDHAAVLARASEQPLDKVSGRGLYLIRTFMDELRFNDRGNRLTMVKRFEPTT